MAFGLRKACWTVLLLLLLGVGAPLAAEAQASAAGGCPSPAPVALREDPQRIERGVEVLFDATHRLQPQQLAETDRCRRFRPIRGTPSFGYEARTVWLRFALPAQTDLREGWHLLVPFSAGDRLCAHWPVRSVGYRSRCGHLEDPLNRGVRTEQGWFTALPLDLDLARPVLLEVYGPNRLLEVPLEVGRTAAFVRLQHYRQTLIGLMFGFLFAALLLGLILFVDQRDFTYLFFFLYVCGVTFYVALRENHLSALGLTGLAAIPWFPVAMALMPIGGVLTHMRLLQTRAHVPRLHRVMLVAMVLAALANVSVWHMSPELRRPLLGGINLGWLLSLLSVIAVRLAQGSRAAIYLLLAWLALGSAGIFRILELMGLPVLEPRRVQTFFYFGLVISTGILMIALLDHIRQLARERDAARELALSNQQLAVHRAHYDPVTRLPNRVKLRESLQERLAQTAPGQQLALVSIGLDRFSALNYALGYHVGDSVLGEITQRLEQRLGADSLLARSGPDGFAWLVELPPGGEVRSELLRRCESLQQALAAPLELGSGATLSASLGLACYPEHAGNAEQLLQCSEAALAHAKSFGPGRLQVFEPALHQSAIQFLELNKELHHALEHSELELHYQPIVGLHSGRVLGVEALARWRRPDGRFVPPDQFVPVAESSDLLRAFTEWGLRSFCQQLALWRARGLEIPSASFNLSASQLRLDGIETLLRDSLRQTSGFTVEVTEGALLENLDATAAMLARLKAQGLALAVDDFGVGYASPHYLRVLPVDILKLDGVFLRGVPHEAEANSVLDSLITLGQSLKLKIITECVETEGQARYLDSRGVQGGQGFWFSRALPVNDLETWLQQWPLRAAA